MESSSFSKIIAILLMLLGVGGIGLGLYYFYNIPSSEETPSLTNIALIDFPGSTSVFYKQYFRYQDDTRLDSFVSVVDYASRGDYEVALVKSDINDTETYVMVAPQGGEFTQLYVADGGEKRMVDISPSGTYVAYSFFSGELRGGVSYGDVNDWQTRIVNTQSGYIEKEISGYAPQFITDEVLFVGTSGGVLTYALSDDSFSEVGLRLPSVVGMIPTRVSGDGLSLIVADTETGFYHILSINSLSPIALTYENIIPMDEGIVLGSAGDTLLLGTSFEKGKYLISERSFQNIVNIRPLYQVDTI